MNLIKKFLQSHLYIIILISVFFIFHLPNLGHDFFNTDVWKWKARSYDFGSGVFNLDFERTIQKYHPGVTLMWLGAFGVKINNVILDNFGAAFTQVQQIFLLDFIQRFLIIVTIFCLIYLLYKKLSFLFNQKIAFLSVILLSIEPFYIALTRVMHLEGLMSTFMLVSAIYLFSYISSHQQQPHTKKTDLYVSAIFGALALLTKTSAIYIVLFTCLSLLLYIAKSPYTLQKYKQLFKDFGIWFIICVLTVIALWPGIWVNPYLVFQVLFKGIYDVGIEGDHIQFYFGKLVDDPGLTFYPVVLFFRSSLLLLPGVVGTFVLLKQKRLSDKEIAFTKYLLLYTTFFMIELLIPSKKLDRYLLPAMLSLSLISSIFYYKLITLVSFRKYLYIGLAAYTSLLFLIYSPDYLSYYNPLGGGLAVGLNVLEPKWIIGVPETIDYFKNLNKQNNFQTSDDTESFEEVIDNGKYKNIMSVGFEEKYYTQIWPFFREMDSWAVITDLKPFAVKTRYFVFPVWSDRSKEVSGLNLREVGQIKIRNVPVYNVYENQNL